MARGFANLPAAQQALAASEGSLHRWSRVNTPQARQAALTPANDARRRQLEIEVDPDGAMTDDERAAAVDRKRRAHMRRIALISAQRRRTGTRSTQ